MDRVQLLGPELLEQHRDIANSFQQRADQLGIDLGWHYLLDLTWIAVELGSPTGLTILDAGAGTGIMQWWLAERGADVISVDRVDRSQLSMRFRMGYAVEGLQSGDLGSYSSMMRVRISEEPTLPLKISGVSRVVVGSLLKQLRPKTSGSVVIHQGDLKNMPEFDSNIFDIVIGVSSLEHNQPEALKEVVAEMERVLKPGGELIATLAAASGEDWYHEPSSGWCYSEASIKDIFGLDPSLESNYQHYDELLTALMDSNELRDNLSEYYFRAGDNGMPWGKWDPQYVPLGIKKRKIASP